MGAHNFDPCRANNLRTHQHEHDVRLLAPHTASNSWQRCFLSLCLGRQEWVFTGDDLLQELFLIGSSSRCMYCTFSQCTVIFSMYLSCAFQMEWSAVHANCVVHLKVHLQRKVKSNPYSAELSDKPETGVCAENLMSSCEKFILSFDL